MPVLPAFPFPDGYAPDDTFYQGIASVTHAPDHGKTEGEMLLELKDAAQLELRLAGEFLKSSGKHPRWIDFSTAEKYNALLLCHMDCVLQTMI